MDDKSFKERLDRGFGSAPPAPRDEFEKIQRRARSAERSQDWKVSLIFCLTTLALAVFVVAFTSKQSELKKLQTALTQSDEESEREFDVSLEKINSLVNSLRPM